MKSNGIPDGLPCQAECSGIKIFNSKIKTGILRWVELYFRLVMKFENQAIIQYLPISGISIFLQIFLPITNLIDINIAGLQNNQDGIRMKKSFFLLYAFLFLGLCACSKHVENKFPATTAQGQIEDLKKFPQNLEVYAKLTGPNKRLLTSLEQEQMAGKYINL